MNVLLLALSTYKDIDTFNNEKHHQLERKFMKCSNRENFRLDHEDYNGINFYTDQEGEDNKANIFSYHTDEPGTKAVINACKNLDVMILLASKKVLKNRRTKYSSCLEPVQMSREDLNHKIVQLNLCKAMDNQGIESSFDVYIDQIRHYISCREENVFPKVYIMEIEDVPSPLQINNYCMDAVRILMELEDEARKVNDSIQLYLELNGGPRETMAIMIGMLRAVSNNRKFELISAMYSVYENGGTSSFQNPKQIIDKKSIYQFLDVVSGLDDFRTTGQSERLIRYFKTMNHELPDPLQAVHDLSHAFLLCHPDGIINAVKKVARCLTEEKSKYNLDKNTNELYLFVLEEIENDFGSEILQNAEASEDDRTIIPIINWSLKKGYFQQALTLCAEKVPDIIVKEKILYYSQNSDNADNSIYSNLNTFKDYNTSGYIFIQNYLCIKPTKENICYQKLYKKVKWKKNEEWSNSPLRQYYWDKAYYNGTYINNVLNKPSVIEGKKIYTKLAIEDTVEILREYYSVKKLRNSTNHASTKDEGEFQKHFTDYKNYDDIKKYLETFIKNVSNAIQQISGGSKTQYPITPIPKVFEESLISNQ